MGFKVGGIGQKMAGKLPINIPEPQIWLGKPNRHGAIQKRLINLETLA